VGGLCTLFHRDALSRRRELVTGSQASANSFEEAHTTRFSNEMERTMLAKSLFSISLMLPLVAMSGIARAGSTITDKSYWPNETRSAASGTAIPSGDWRSARASDRRTPQIQAVPSYSPRESGWTYQGGPKSPTMTPQF
jgi:hypothetical protein